MNLLQEEEEEMRIYLYGFFAQIFSNRLSPNFPNEESKLKEYMDFSYVLVLVETY